MNLCSSMRVCSSRNCILSGLSKVTASGPYASTPCPVCVVWPSCYCKSPGAGKVKWVNGTILASCLIVKTENHHRHSLCIQVGPCPTILEQSATKSTTRSSKARRMFPAGTMCCFDYLFLRVFPVTVRLAVLEHMEWSGATSPNQPPINKNPACQRLNNGEIRLFHLSSGELASRATSRYLSIERVLRVRSGATPDAAYVTSTEANPVEQALAQFPS
jgi:hypothetical protein